MQKCTWGCLHCRLRAAGILSPAGIYEPGSKWGDKTSDFGWGERAPKQTRTSDVFSASNPAHHFFDMAEVIDGHKIANLIYQELKPRISDLKSRGVIPCLAVIMIGSNPVSRTYVRTKQQRAGDVGIRVVVKRFETAVSEQVLLRAIAEQNSDASVHGVIIQLPLPSEYDKQKILDAIAPEKDVDCLTSVNTKCLAQGENPAFIPPTANAIMQILEDLGPDWHNKQILLVGRGDLVGKPLAALLQKHGIKFQITGRVPDLSHLTGTADIIVTGAGRPGLIKVEMIKAGAVIIDAGTAETTDGAIAGDADFASIKAKVGAITPTPGGVGPVTVAMLLYNVVESAVQKTLTDKKRRDKV